MNAIARLKKAINDLDWKLAHSDKYDMPVDRAQIEYRIARLKHNLFMLEHQLANQRGKK